MVTSRARNLAPWLPSPASPSWIVRFGDINWVLKCRAGPRLIRGTISPKRILGEIAAFSPDDPAGKLLRSAVNLGLEPHDAATARAKIIFGSQRVKPLRCFKRKSATVQVLGLFRL